MSIEEMNAKARKVGLHVAASEKADAFTIRSGSTGKLVAKNVTAAEALTVIEAEN